MERVKWKLIMERVKKKVKKEREKNRNRAREKSIKDRQGFKGKEILLLKVSSQTLKVQRFSSSSSSSACSAVSELPHLRLPKILSHTTHPN